MHTFSTSSFASFLQCSQDLTSHFIKQQEVSGLSFLNGQKFGYPATAPHLCPLEGQ